MWELYRMKRRVDMYRNHKGRNGGPGALELRQQVVAENLAPAARALCGQVGAAAAIPALALSKNAALHPIDSSRMVAIVSLGSSSSSQEASAGAAAPTAAPPPPVQDSPYLGREERQLLEQGKAEHRETTASARRALKVGLGAF